MPGKRVLTDCSKQTQKRGKKAKPKSTNSKPGEMDTENNSDSGTDKLSVSKVLDLEADGATEYLCPIEKEGDTVLEVECGPNKALMYLSKLYQGSKGSCLSFQGSWLTPNEFQYVSGRETAKDWKRSIRHQGKSIKLLFSKGILSVGGSSKNAKRPKKGGKRSSSARRGRRKVNVSLDSAGEENGESRETEVKCREEQEGETESKDRKNNSDTSKEVVNGEGDLSDANSDSTENYDVDFMDSVTEPDKVISENDDKFKHGLTTNKLSAPTPERFQKKIDVFSFEASEESNSSLKTDSTCEKNITDDEIVPEETITSECDTKVKDVDDVVEENTLCVKNGLGEYTFEDGDNKTEEEESAEQPTEGEPISDEKEIKKIAELETSEENKDDTVVTMEEKEVINEDEATEEKQEEIKLAIEEEVEDEEQKVEEQKVSSKRPSPARESKLGSIIDQLRVNREKVTKERRENGAELTTRESQEEFSKKDCPSDISKKRDLPTDLTKESRQGILDFRKETQKGIEDFTKIGRESMHSLFKPEDGKDFSKETRGQDTAKLNKAGWQMPAQTTRNPLATEMKIAKIIDEQRKDSRRHAPCTEEKKVPKGHPLSANIHQKKHPERTPSEIMEFLSKKRGGTPTSDRHSFPSAGMLYPWIKKESDDTGDRSGKSQTSSPSARLTPVDKVKKSSSSTREKKESSSEKDYNDYMRVLAAKQERNPFFLSPPVHDPYFSMWTPDLLFPPGLFNPYSMFLGPNGQRAEVPTTTSMSTLCSMPSGGLPGFMTPPRPPHNNMSYPILDSYVPHTSPKESPSLPHSCQNNSRKRGPAEADTACALDLSTKRTKLECSKNDYLNSPLSRSSESVDNCKKSSLLNLSNEKLPEGDKSNIHKTHNSHRHKKSNHHSIWLEKDIKGQKLQCKCGADNPDNIMNWSAEKVFDFVSKLEGCSSYAKTFLAHRIEGKLLPLLTTDALIRNLGMKVGPAIILSEAVTRHVQDMSRFFHPCSYCKLKTSQRLSV
ncbi:uncharacterized protein DDB_G0283697-like [Pecten maximus]|uniref:uncharacterized protein DDB_G0283697-like n=1 Tax=Pecten maximus TaxID=6579 RepID=UPI0014580B44|nr:uncharacterized protein DDB_G0283697-like [Pecten maximus]